MLEPEEVDEDYFTPVTSTTLASIFGNKTEKESIENESLKYTPPKQHISTKKSEESKTSVCIFACALLVYEWAQNVYTPKGKLGFAIIKILKNNTYNVILYDANKITISCTIITPNLKITINEQNYISYYDSNQRYWSIYGSEDESKKIIDLLKSFDVTIQYVSQTDKGPPEPDKTEIPTTLNFKGTESKDIASDTDSSINRKTKASLLNRMATMGHSVLPPRANVIAKTSDSSDTNDTYEHPKTRHKPVKSIVKRNSSEKPLFHEQNIAENQQKISILPKSDLSQENIPSLYTYINGQLVPVTNTNVISNPNNRVCNELDFFITEQRVSSSELRINMSRITDKVDHILNKVNSLEHSDNINAGSNFQYEVLQKLLKEYEEKIKRYEVLLNSQSVGPSFDLTDAGKNTSLENEITVLKGKIENLEATHQIKSVEIVKLQEEIKSLKESHIEEMEKNHVKENDLLGQIKHLEETLVSRDEKTALEQQSHKKVFQDSNEMGDRIKKIMNETYRAVSANFDNDEMYPGENVRNVIALIIKKITMDSLNNV